MSNSKREAFLTEVRERASKATPGPWQWRGNVDVGDPYLAGGRHRDKDGKPAGMANDVLGHIPHEITAQEARQMGIGDPDYLPPLNVPAEPRETYGDRYDAALNAAIDADITDKLQDRYGEPVKESRLAFCTDYMYTQARDLAIFEVAPSALARHDPRVYRADIIGIRHPDAEFIAHSREDVTRLLAIIDELQMELAECGEVAADDAHASAVSA